MRTLAMLVLFAVSGCETPGTVPPGGWANVAATRVERVVERADASVLEVRQGSLTTWVSVPRVAAQPGDYVLLGAGSAREEVAIPELGITVPVLVSIDHARVVDEVTARRQVVQASPGTVSLTELFATAGEGDEVTVHGTVVKATWAVGWWWVHLQDGTGSAATGDDDLTIKTADALVVGQRVEVRGRVRKDVDLGFGYHFRVLLEATGG